MSCCYVYVFSKDGIRFNQQLCKPYSFDLIFRYFWNGGNSSLEMHQSLWTESDVLSWTFGNVWKRCHTWTVSVGIQCTRTLS